MTTKSKTLKQYDAFYRDEQRGWVLIPPPSVVPLFRPPETWVGETFKEVVGRVKACVLHAAGQIADADGKPMTQQLMLMNVDDCTDVHYTSVTAKPRETGYQAWVETLIKPEVKYYGRADFPLVRNDFGCTFAVYLGTHLGENGKHKWARCGYVTAANFVEATPLAYDLIETVLEIPEIAEVLSDNDVSADSNFRFYLSVGAMGEMMADINRQQLAAGVMPKRSLIGPHEDVVYQGMYISKSNRFVSENKVCHTTTTSQRSVAENE